MPTKATPADTFDLADWLASPAPRAPLNKFVVQPLDLDRPLTVVVRGQNGDDHDAVARVKAATGDGELSEEIENEIFMARCIVGILPGKVDVDLDAFEIPEAQIVNREQVRALRNRILEPQWNALLQSVMVASLTMRQPEPSAPSSPKS